MCEAHLWFDIVLGAQGLKVEGLQCAMHEHRRYKGFWVAEDDLYEQSSEPEPEQVSSHGEETRHRREGGVCDLRVQTTAQCLVRGLDGCCEHFSP